MEGISLHFSRSIFLSLSLLLLTACGGGGGGSDDGGNNFTDPGDDDSSTWEEDVFLPASTFTNRCVNPRSGTNPQSGKPYSDVLGTREDENNWLRSMSNELYLWYGEIEDRDPADFGNSLEYFDQLKTNAVTATGADKDKFHYTVPTSEWVAQSQSGVYVGYGLQWALISLEPPRKAVVAYTETEDGAGLPPVVTRGAEILSVDGVVLKDGVDVDTLNAGMWPEEDGETHIFEFLPLGASEPVVVELTAGPVTSEPVQHVHSFYDDMSGKQVGYMLFTDHIATAEPALVDAVNQLKVDGAEELVLDLRYNSGGYLYIASQLAYMIAGDGPTAGQPFEHVIWNDKHPETDPVTGDPLTPTPFYDVTSGNSSLQEDLPLPTLGLSRVFVLTGGSTCSASEAIINGLRGVGVEVVQIGNTTCGKPYGFYGLDNCGTSYFTIQFKGINAAGYGDYTDGFIPAGTTGTDADVPGCKMGDDFSHLLGDREEARFATAIHYIQTGGSCMDIPASGYARGALGTSMSGADARVSKSVWRSNRIMVR